MSRHLRLPLLSLLVFVIAAASLYANATRAPGAAANPVIGLNCSTWIPYDVDACRAAGAKVVRVEWDIAQPATNLDQLVRAHADRGIRVQPLAGFDGRLPSVTEARNLRNWATRFGPGGTFWQGRSDGHLAVESIEFGNETSYGYQFGDDWSKPSYAQRARDYALRAKEAGLALQGTGVGLLVQGDDGGSGASVWVDQMFAAVPDIRSYVAGWTVHPYGPTAGPAKLDRMRSQLARWGDTSIPFYLTEWGIGTDNGRALNDNYGWPLSMTYDQAAAAFRDTLAKWKAAHGTRVAQVMIYQGRDRAESGASNVGELYFGVIRRDGADKGAFTAEIRAQMNAGSTAPPPPNDTPVATASASPTNGTAPLAVRFDGTRSRDFDGTIVAWAWDLDGDGQFDDSAAQNPVHTYATAATYVAKLRVTDNAGAQDESDPVTVVVVATTPVPNGQILLSTLAPSVAINGWGPVEKDSSNGEQAPGDGRTLTLDGTTYDKGLGVHALSDVQYALAGKCSRFRAVVGVDDEVGAKGSVSFEVYADASKAYDSGTLTGSSASKQVDVSITDAQTLRLVVRNAGDGSNHDHADWASARVECGTVVPPAPDPSPTPEPNPDPGPTPTSDTFISTLAPSVAINGWGPVEKDSSNGEQAPGDGRTLTLDGTTYDKGLGVHALSDVQYALAGKCSRFRAVVGVDDEVGAKGSVSFEVYADASKAYDSGTLTGSSASKQVDVSITDAQTLRLVVRNAGDGSNHDHADWASARVECGTVVPPAPDPSPTPEPNPDPGPTPTSDTFISTLAPSVAINGWGPVEKDSSNGEQAPGDGRTLTLDGTTYDKGLGVHALSDVQYALAGKCSRFRAVVGVDDEVGAKGSVSFEVYADASKAYDSGTLTGSSASKQVDVSITDAQTLRLVVRNAGDGSNHDHADWASARVECTANPTALTSRSPADGASQEPASAAPSPAPPPTTSGSAGSTGTTVGGAPQPAQPPTTDSVDLYLVAAGPDPGRLMKILRRETDLDVNQLRGRLADAPGVLLYDIPRAKADWLRRALADAGATVEVR